MSQAPAVSTAACARLIASRECTTNIPYFISPQYDFWLDQSRFGSKCWGRQEVGVSGRQSCTDVSPHRPSARVVLLNDAETRLLLPQGMGELYWGCFKRAGISITDATSAAVDELYLPNTASACAIRAPRPDGRRKSFVGPFYPGFGNTGFINASFYNCRLGRDPIARWRSTGCESWIDPYGRVRLPMEPAELRQVEDQGLGRSACRLMICTARPSTVPEASTFWTAVFAQQVAIGCGSKWRCQRAACAQRVQHASQRARRVGTGKPGRCGAVDQSSHRSPIQSWQTSRRSGK